MPDSAIAQALGLKPLALRIMTLKVDQSSSIPLYLVGANYSLTSLNEGFTTDPANIHTLMRLNANNMCNALFQITEERAPRAKALVSLYPNIIKTCA